MWCIKPCSGAWHLIKPRAELSSWSYSTNSSFHGTIKQAEVRDLLDCSADSPLHRARGYLEIVVSVLLRRTGLRHTDVRNSLKPVSDDFWEGTHCVSCSLYSSCLWRWVLQVSCSSPGLCAHEGVSVSKPVLLLPAVILCYSRFLVSVALWPAFLLQPLIVKNSP